MFKIDDIIVYEYEESDDNDGIQDSEYYQVLEVRRVGGYEEVSIINDYGRRAWYDAGMFYKKPFVLKDPYRERLRLPDWW